ncbi:MAG: molybdopterin-dependent oxidoreductase, partial [Gammaproteobacteria bacterium]|nr:molybdopterin-dependent oxidoreductase [Gammaproteobacteria bacterium]
MSANAPNNSNNKTEVKNTTCYMCACRCGIRVTLEDGVVRYIQGNPEHPLNKGVICAKGSSGIMKQYSPARLTKPLLRKQGSKRGDSEFEAISWDQAFEILETRLGKIRSTDPKKFALFTGRDQMQALTGLFARQFGTPNYAAHGGFCSVNMAAGMIYTIGGSFWEFGGPDVDHAKVLMMFGTAEDHHSNPLKMALSKFKRNGGRFISVNPVRTGYSAIADEWVPIKPGTDGAFIMAMLKVIIDENLYDVDFLQRYTNSAQLVITDDKHPESGMIARNEQGEALCWDTKLNTETVYPHNSANFALDGSYTLKDGTRVSPSFELLKQR